MQCQGCNQYKSSSHFTRLVRSTRGYNYTCKECTKVKCLLCDKTLSNKYTLKVHMISHEGVKTFECYKCDKKYASKSSLARHLCKIDRLNNDIAVKFDIKALIKPERYWQYVLENYLGGRSEGCDLGIADIVTPHAVIEIKAWQFWQQAIGQVIAYGTCFPDLVKMIVFFGEAPKKADAIIEACLKTGIIALDISDL